MKRLWLGAGILLALLGAGVWIMVYADRQSQAVCQALTRAQQADTSTMVDFATEAKQAWENNWGMWSSLSDHTELDEIDAGFARLEVYAQQGHTTDFAAQCAALIRQVEALGEGHRLTWRNLL